MYHYIDHGLVIQNVNHTPYSVHELYNGVCASLSDVYSRPTHTLASWTVH